MNHHADCPLAWRTTQKRGKLTESSPCFHVYQLKLFRTWFSQKFRRDKLQKGTSSICLSVTFFILPLMKMENSSSLCFFSRWRLGGSIWWFYFLNFILTVPKPQGGFSHLATSFWINCLFSPRLTPSCFQTQRRAARWLYWYPLCSGRSWGPVCFMTFQSDEKVLLATLWGIFQLPTVWVFHLNPIFLVRH